MVKKLEQCTSNITPSTVSSCTEYVSPSTRDRSNTCSERCQHCSYFINDHTYTILKKLCRRLIKNYNAAENRERYTVFEGGNSINVRIRRASNLSNEACGYRNEGLGEMYGSRERDYCRSTSAYNCQQRRQPNKQYDNICRNYKDEDLESGRPRRKCRNKFDADDDETTRPRSCGRNWQPDGESNRSKDQKFVRKHTEPNSFDSKFKTEGNGRNKRTTKYKTPDDGLQVERDVKKKTKSPRRQSLDIVDEEKPPRKIASRKGRRSRTGDYLDVDVDTDDDDRIKRSKYKLMKQPNDDDVGDDDYRKRKNRLRKPLREDYTDDDEDEPIGRKKKKKDKQPKLPLDELDDNVINSRKKRSSREKENMPEIKTKLEKIKPKAEDDRYEDVKVGNFLKDIKHKDRDKPVMNAAYNKEYGEEEPSFKRTPKKKGKIKQPPDEVIEVNLQKQKKTALKEEPDDYYYDDKGRKGPKGATGKVEVDVALLDGYPSNKSSKIINDKDKLMDDGNVNSAVVSSVITNLNGNDRFIKGRSLKKKKEEEIIERKWEDDFDSGGKTRVQDMIKSPGKKSKGKKNKNKDKDIIIEIVENTLPEVNVYDKPGKLGKGRLNQSDMERFDASVKGKSKKSNKSSKLDKLDRKNKLDQVEAGKIDEYDKSKFDKPDTYNKFDKYDKSKSDKSGRGKFVKNDRRKKFDKPETGKIDEYDKSKFDEYDKSKSDKPGRGRFDRYDKSKFDKPEVNRFDKYDKGEFDKPGRGKLDKYDKSKFDRPDTSKRDKYDKGVFDKPPKGSKRGRRKSDNSDTVDSREKTRREPDDGTEVVYYNKKKVGKRKKSLRNKNDDDDRYGGDHKSPPSVKPRPNLIGKTNVYRIPEGTPIITDLRRKVRSGQNITAEMVKRRPSKKPRRIDGIKLYRKPTQSSSRNLSLSSNGRIRGLTERFRNLETNDADYLRAVMEQRELCLSQSQQICDPCQPTTECLKQNSCICANEKDDYCRIPCLF